MKKSDLFLGFFLLALLTGGIWGIGMAIDAQEQTGVAPGYEIPAAPVLSAESGCYKEPFVLHITAPEHTDIYYTLDGSRPTVNSLLYTEPLTISGGTGDTYVPNMQEYWMDGEGESHANIATVIRAAAIDKNGVSSSPVTASYFIGQDFLEDHTVISIVADPDDLFGDNGIYVTGKAYDDWYLNGQQGDAPMPNFLQKGKVWERPAVMEILQGESVLQQPVGIRIQGASMRYGENKRFSVYARKEYSGSSWFDIPLFGDWRTHSLALRSGFMNGYIMHLVQDRNIASAESNEVLVYLNGAMWYITIAQEKYSERYFQEKYGVDKDNVIIAKHGIIDTGKDGDQALYQAVYDFLESHDMSDPDAYEAFDRIIDIQSYIDYSCVNVYFGNLDYNETKNTLCWRARKPGKGEYEDGRWRWALYDLDLENLNYGVAWTDLNTFVMETHYAGGPFNTRPMWAALKQNALFRQQFVLSFMDMVNTTFTTDRAASAMDSWEITPYWWGMQQEWVQEFFPARTEAITGYLAEELALTGSRETLTLSVNDPQGGRIVLNTITPDLSQGSWSGTYFTDYPVTVTAVAEEGYVFTGWESSGLSPSAGSSAAVTVEIPVGGLSLQAVFRKK